LIKNNWQIQLFEENTNIIKILNGRGEQCFIQIDLFDLKRINIAIIISTLKEHIE
jgi:hypothetical protein